MTTASLVTWLERQYRFAATAMLRSVSATSLVKTRPDFGQTVVPHPGSVLASPEVAAYDPDPDYFFHWFRDSALVMDAVRVLYAAGTLGPEAVARLEEFLRFNHALAGLRGSAIVDGRDIRAGVEARLRKYVRSDAQLLAVHGEGILGEVRVNPDATLDTLVWSRPQHDGPALRALTCLRWRDLAAVEDVDSLHLMRGLIEDDLDFTSRSWPEPCFDLWEEDLGHHYYTRLVQLAALERGAAWAQDLHDGQRRRAYEAAAGEIGRALDEHWSPRRGFYLKRIRPDGDEEAKDLDIAPILAVLHGDRMSGPHSVVDPRMQATLARLEMLFEGEYPINRNRPAGRAPAMGRYSADSYYSGGAYYFATLGTAEFYFRLAEAVGAGAAFAVTADNAVFAARLLGRQAAPGAWPAGARPSLVAALVRRGDMFLETVRAYTPASGELAEQFDQATGAPTSAKNLAWSYAALITATDRRRRAVSTAATVSAGTP